MGRARVSEVGRVGEEEEAGTDSCCLMCKEDELFFSVRVPGLAGPEAESESASASRSQPESSNTMSKEEEVQSLGPRGGQSSKEWGVSEASGSAWLSLSDIRLSWTSIGWKDRSPNPTPIPAAPLESRDRVSAEASSPGSETGDTELDTGTLTDSASMLSTKLIGQSVVLKEGKQASSYQEVKKTGRRSCSMAGTVSYANIAPSVSPAERPPP